MWQLIALALTPAVLLITYVYFNGRHEREPLVLLIWTFEMGSLRVLPALVFSLGWLVGCELDGTTLAVLSLTHL